jgi:predicted component of type VI protein secretion system
VGEPRRITSYLVYTLSGGQEQVVIWDTLEITVGRQEAQDIVVPDAEVSREHAVFRKKGDVYSVEDLGTGLGTLVNGERVKLHELQRGDRIEIGSLALKFGQTQRTVRAGGMVRFASELKGFGMQMAGAEGRTMLAFDSEQDLPPPTLPPQARASTKAVSADGTLEDLAGADPLASDDFEQFLGPPPRVRDLDRELAADPAMGLTQSVAKLELEIEGPKEQVRALLEAIVGKPISVPPLTIRIREPKRG